MPQVGTTAAAGTPDVALDDATGTPDLSTSPDAGTPDGVLTAHARGADVLQPWSDAISVGCR